MVVVKLYTLRMVISVCLSVRLLYEFCYYNPMYLLHHLEKGKEELSPLQYHIKSLHIISRHYKKSLLRSQYTMDMKNYLRTQITLYEEDKKEVYGAACFMAAEIKFSKDVRLSVTPFSQCSSHRIIMKFSGVITNDRSVVHAKGQGQRSKVKVTEVVTPFSHFRTVTPV